MMVIVPKVMNGVFMEAFCAYTVIKTNMMIHILNYKIDCSTKQKKNTELKTE